MKFDYIHFVELGNKGLKTRIWACCNNKSGDELGIVKWYAPWRQYCYFPNADTIFNVGCMNDICRFIEWQMKMWRLGKESDGDLFKQYESSPAWRQGVR